MKLLEQVRHVARVKHLAYRTEQAYAYWIERYIRFHGIRHPNTMGAAEVEAFLTSLAVEGRVAASTQNQALEALLFLYRNVLQTDIGNLNAVRALNRCDTCSAGERMALNEPLRTRQVRIEYAASFTEPIFSIERDLLCSGPILAANCGPAM